MDAPLPLVTCSGDLLGAARVCPGVLFTHPWPCTLRPGGLVLAASGHGGALLVTARRDHAGGFSLRGEGLSPTPQRPTLTLRAVSEAGEPWAATPTRAGRIYAQLDRWWQGERRKDEASCDLEALLALRRGLIECALVGPHEVGWLDAHGCWTCLDLHTGELTRLDAPPTLLLALLRAGGEALSLAGQAWTYSLADQRSPIAVCWEGTELRARRVSAWREGLLIAYQAGRAVTLRPQGR